MVQVRSMHLSSIAIAFLALLLSVVLAQDESDKKKASYARIHYPNDDTVWHAGQKVSIHWFYVNSSNTEIFHVDLLRGVKHDLEFITRLCKGGTPRSTSCTGRLPTDLWEYTYTVRVSPDNAVLPTDKSEFFFIKNPNDPRFTTTTTKTTKTRTVTTAKPVTSTQVTSSKPVTSTQTTSSKPVTSTQTTTVKPVTSTRTSSVKPVTSTQTSSVKPVTSTPTRPVTTTKTSTRTRTATTTTKSRAPTTKPTAPCPTTTTTKTKSPKPTPPCTTKRPHHPGNPGGGHGGPGGGHGGPGGPGNPAVTSTASFIITTMITPTPQPTNTTSVTFVPTPTPSIRSGAEDLIVDRVALKVSVLATVFTLLALIYLL
ncbi:hypothetical protein BGW42_007927 [Actinomortierella wolfii]|nr:hypothetical protein BGW42_007927 [Actinomortierella wolfii]